MALIPPLYMNTVVAIGFNRNDGTHNYVATGFLFGLRSGENQYAIYLVTNRHVFQNQITAWLRFNPEGAEPAREFSIALVDEHGASAYTTHPDREIDVAVIRLNGRVLQEQKIQFGWFYSDQHVLSRDDAKEAGLSEGDGVFVLGFPMGLIGQQRNFVIVRHGVIARIADALDEKADEFLVDVLIFPGNSGGPVVCRPELTAIQGTKPIKSASLIGVVKGYVPYQDVAVSTQTQRPRITFEENSGLASVIPIDYVIETIKSAHQDKKPQAAGEEVITDEDVDDPAMNIE